MPAGRPAPAPATTRRPRRCLRRTAPARGSRRAAGATRACLPASWGPLRRCPTCGAEIGSGAMSAGRPYRSPGKVPSSSTAAHMCTRHEDALHALSPQTCFGRQYPCQPASTCICCSSMSNAAKDAGGSGASRRQRCRAGQCPTPERGRQAAVQGGLRGALHGGQQRSSRQLVRGKSVRAAQRAGQAPVLLQQQRALHRDGAAYLRDEQPRRQRLQACSAAHSPSRYTALGAARSGSTDARHQHACALAISSACAVWPTGHRTRW